MLGNLKRLARQAAPGPRGDGFAAGVYSLRLRPLALGGLPNSVQE